VRRSRWRQWRWEAFALAFGSDESVVFVLALMEVRCVCVDVFVGANDSR